MEENLNLKSEETLAPEDMVVVQPKPRPVSMGEIVDEMVPDYQADELATDLEEEEEEAQESRESGIELDAVQTQEVEKRNLATVEMNREEFSESVKPMDTIELDFQELIGTVSMYKSELKSPQGVSKTSIEKIGFGKFFFFVWV